jgi:hypothetical protein
MRVVCISVTQLTHKFSGRLSDWLTVLLLRIFRWHQFWILGLVAHPGVHLVFRSKSTQLTKQYLK